MRTSIHNTGRHALAAKTNWSLVIIIGAAALCGLIAMRVGGFDFAPNAPNLFLTKLPVLFLVALLVERTGEIFLTIWRGADAVGMQMKLDALIALKEAKTKRDARLAELPAKITACGTAIAQLAGAAGKEAELKVQQDQKAALEKEKAELDAAKRKEDQDIAALEGADLDNSEKGTVENRTHELSDYKNQTRSIAMTLNFVVALFVAACGFRAMDGLVVLQPPGSTPQVTSPKFDPAQLKELTQRLVSQIQSDRESIGKATEAGAREIIKRQQDDAWAGWIDRELKDKLIASKPVEPAAGVPTPPAQLNAYIRYEIMAFRFFDILLTAGLLAGGADPISRIMKLLRDFLDQSNKQVKDKDK